MTDKIDPTAAEAAARQVLDALPQTIGAMRVAGLEQARLMHEQRLASARRQLALETLNPRSSKRAIAAAEARVKAREAAAGQVRAMRDAAAVAPVRESDDDAVVFGRVVDGDGGAAAGLAVAATDATGKAIAAATTDKRGGFSLTVPPGQAFSLVVTGADGALAFREDGTAVAAGETAFRHVSLKKAGGAPPGDELTMPDLAGQNVAVAEAVLTRIGLALGKVVDVETDSAAAGTVLASRPRAGATVAPGQAVELDVARKPEAPEEPKVAVPDLVGRSLKDAEKRLEWAGLAVAKVIELRSDAQPGTVLASDPKATTMVGPGTGVSLTVAVKRGAGPDVRPVDEDGVVFLERLVEAASDDALAGAMPLAPVALMAALRKAGVSDPASLAKLVDREPRELKDALGLESAADARRLSTRLRAAAKKIAAG